MPIEIRSTQTKIKHLILEEYLGIWGGIILQGLRGRAAQGAASGQVLDVHFVYVDCFASNGRYERDMVVEGNQTEVVFGSPIIGVRALDSLSDFARTIQGLRLQTNTILIEREYAEFQELQTSLDMTGLRPRVQETNRFTTLRDGEIALLRGDSTIMAPELTAYTTKGFVFAFYLLDPYGPTGIPLPFVKDIICQKRHDVMINMIYQDLHKKIGMAEKMQLSPEEYKLLQHYDTMFGHNRWRNVAKQLDLGDVWEAEMRRLLQPKPFLVHPVHASSLELDLVHMYRDSLQSVDNNLAIKPIGLRFPDRERTMFYLYLTTHDPTGALKMNEVLSDAGYEEYILRDQLRQQKRQATGQISMFDLFGSLSEEPQQEKPVRQSTDDIARAIFRKFAGQRVNRRDVYKAVVNESYFPTEVDSALKLLRKRGMATFEGSTLFHKTLIDFQAE